MHGGANDDICPYSSCKAPITKTLLKQTNPGFGVLNSSRAAKEKRFSRFYTIYYFAYKHVCRAASSRSLSWYLLCVCLQGKKTHKREKVSLKKTWRRGTGAVLNLHQHFQLVCRSQMRKLPDEWASRRKRRRRRSSSESICLGECAAATMFRQRLASNRSGDH